MAEAVKTGKDFVVDDRDAVPGQLVALDRGIGIGVDVVEVCSSCTGEHVLEKRIAAVSCISKVPEDLWNTQR